MTRMSLDALPVPGSPASAAALDVATAYLPPALLNHSLRAYVWAAARGTADGLTFDPELLYVAALHHDIGLVPAFDSHTVAFEEASGHVARVFAAGAGWPAERRERLADVIVRHMAPQVDAATDPEGHLLARATATEITGKGADDYPPASATRCWHATPGWTSPSGSWRASRPRPRANPEVPRAVRCGPGSPTGWRPTRSAPEPGSCSPNRARGPCRFSARA